MRTIKFTKPNSRDNKILHGIIWTPVKPKAVIALVHGLGEHCERYHVMAKALGPKGIAMATLDLHGHGKTSGKRGVNQDYAVLQADIDALLAKTDETFPGLPIILMGHSMGGGLVLKYALDRPDLSVAGIIAQAPMISAPKRPPALIFGIMKLIRKIAPNFAVQSKFKGSDISTLAEEADIYVNDPLNHGYLGVGLGIDLFAAGDDIAARAAEFPHDVLITHGTKDVLTSYDASAAFASKAPRVTFKTYAGSAHEIHNDFCRHQVHADITDWVNARI